MTGTPPEVAIAQPAQVCDWVGRRIMEQMNMSVHEGWDAMVQGGGKGFPQLQAVQQACLQALEAGIDDRHVETQTWQRLVDALNEQVSPNHMTGQYKHAHPFSIYGGSCSRQHPPGR